MHARAPDSRSARSALTPEGAASRPTAAPPKRKRRRAARATSARATRARRPLAATLRVRTSTGAGHGQGRVRHEACSLHRARRADHPGSEGSPYLTQFPNGRTGAGRPRVHTMSSAARLRATALRSAARRRGAAKKARDAQRRLFDAFFRRCSARAGPSCADGCRRRADALWDKDMTMSRAPRSRSCRPAARAAQLAPRQVLARRRLYAPPRRRRASVVLAYYLLGLPARCAQIKLALLAAADTSGRARARHVRRAGRRRRSRCSTVFARAGRPSSRGAGDRESARPAAYSRAFTRARARAQADRDRGRDARGGARARATCVANDDGDDAPFDRVLVAKCACSLDVRAARAALRGRPL